MGGFATEAQPYLWIVGSTDPRVRSFTKKGPPQPTNIGPLVVDVPTPPVEDLDRIALLWGFVDGGKIGNGFGIDMESHPPKWSDLSPDQQRAATALWLQAVELGPLPEDTQSDTPTSAEWADWPEPNQPERRVYIWRLANGTLYKHMQVQKRDHTGRWRIFNKWGTNLTFVWRPERNVWEAGWDFGDWWTQNAREIGGAIQVACYAIFTICTFGAGASVAAAGAAAMAAGKAMASGMQALVSGDLGAAALSFLSVASNISASGNAVGVDVGKELNKAVPDGVREIANAPAMRSLAAIVGDAATQVAHFQDWSKRLDLAAFTRSVASLGAALPYPSAEDLAQARGFQPANLRVWFDFGLRDARNLAADTAGVPWYAVSSYTQGAVLGELERVKTAELLAPQALAPRPPPVKATRIRATPPPAPAPTSARPARAARVRTPAQKAATVGATALAALAALRLLRLF